VSESPSRHGHVVMHFADGATIDTWNELDLRENFTEPLSDLSFECAPPRRHYDDYRQRLAKGELVTVLINGVNQGGFIINEVDRYVSAEQGCVIRVRCHTPLVTPYEGNVDPDISLEKQTDVPVLDAVLQALRPFGFTRIVGDSASHVTAVSGRPLGGQAQNVNVSALKHQEAVAHEGETAYAFAARIITRLGCALRVNAQGTLMVSAPNYEQGVNDTLRQSFTAGLPGDYFIGTVHVHDSNAGQFSECIVRGQRADSGNDLTARPVSRIVEAELHPERPSYRSPIAAPYKPKYFKDRSSRDPQRALNAAKLEMGLRAAKAFWVQGEVDGFVSYTGRIWQTDTLVRVVVDAEQLDETMWILEVQRVQNAAGGQRTRFKLLPMGAFIMGDIPQ
jgi:prophage tail gpP-like protein